MENVGVYTYAMSKLSIEFPPCPAAPDMSDPIMFCTLGSDIMEVAMFIRAGFSSMAPRLKPMLPETEVACSRGIEDQYWKFKTSV